MQEETRLFDLVAIGNPVYDEIITPYVQTEERILSGCSTNACLAARKLGLNKVALIGYIGRDYEDAFRAHMAKYNIEVSNVEISENTGGFRLIYDVRGDRTLDVLGVAGKIVPDNIPLKYLDAKIILIAPILQEVNLETVRFLRENSQAMLFLDPQGLIREISEGGRIVEKYERDLAVELAGLVDIIKPNEHESIVLTGLENPSMSANQLVEWGAKIAIVTLAERGSIIRNSESCATIPAYKTTAKDPTGAGDTYAGAFIKKYLENRPLLECGFFASAAASIKVEYCGPDFPMTYSAVTQRIEMGFSS